MNLFATGFPGFIAQRLLPEVVANGAFDRIILLVEERFRERAERLAAELFPENRVEIAVGDITQPGLGLGGAGAGEFLLKEPAEWWHLAAVYRLDVNHELAHKINVQGTREVLELAKTAPVERFHYISTAYVSGKATGRVMESDLPEPRRRNFKNFYELTKNEAEWLARAAMPQIPIVIYRFAVVTGDSRTGATAKFDGPFFVIKYLDRWGSLPLPAIGSMEARINIVPVDFAIQAAAAISRQPESVGKCFQIVDPNPITTGEMFEFLSRALGHGPPRWQISPEGMDRMMRFSLIRRMVGIPRQAMAYVNHPVEYDCTNTLKALEGTGIACPNAKTYLPNLVRFFKENQDREDLHMAVE